MKSLLRRILLTLCRSLGTRVVDFRTGAVLGRAWFFGWGGKIHVIGADPHWLPAPLPQRRLTYWQQTIGFTTHDCICPDRTEAAANLLQSSANAETPPRVLVVILDHRTDQEVQAVLDRWQALNIPPEDLLLVYGGTSEGFEALSWKQKRFLDDSRLRTQDHQREAQSYRSVLDEVTQWMEGTSYTHVLFMESDHVGVTPMVLENYLEALAQQDADVLGYAVQRVDGTLHPHWLGTVETTYGGDPVWSMMGTGHFWKRPVWETVTRDSTCATWYLELDFATSAVRNGFRLVGLTKQDPYVMNLAERLPCVLEEAAEAGAWTLHPVKGTIPPPW